MALLKCPLPFSRSEAKANRFVERLRYANSCGESGSVNPIRLPARSPNLNSYAERWVRSVKEECLAKLILFGESSLRRALQQYLLHYKYVSYCPTSLCG